MSGSLLLIVELIVLFFAISTSIELLQRRVGRERLRAWMGGAPASAALKGILVGFITPFCTYSAIPMLVGLRKAGVPPAGYVAFIVAAPVLDPVLFGALVLIVGLPVAVLYVAVAFSAAMLLALAAQRSDIERHLKPVGQFATVGVGPGDAETPADGAVSGCSAGDAPEAPWTTWPTELRRAGASAVGLLRTVGPLLLAGVAVGLVIEWAVSPDLVARLTGSVASIPLAAAFGVPLYFHTELLIPIADSLTAAGAGVGTVVALTISGAGANVPEFVILTKLARARLIVWLFVYVFSVAVVGGLLAEALVG